MSVSGGSDRQKEALVRLVRLKAKNPPSIPKSTTHIVKVAP